MEEARMSSSGRKKGRKHRLVIRAKWLIRKAKRSKSLRLTLRVLRVLSEVMELLSNSDGLL